MKAWCGAEDEPPSKRVKKEVSSDDDDYSDADTRGNIQIPFAATNLV